ncbi:MAG: hypothetical protein JW827_07905 [Spirochaetes bacterium]|nr:hypothetical protein [Spirochaetota bacterium]
MELLSQAPAFFYYLIFKPRMVFDYLYRSREEDHVGIALGTASLAFVFGLIGKAVALKKQLLITFFIEINIIPYIVGFFGNIFLLSAIWFFVKSFIGQSKQKKDLQKNRSLILFKSICFSYFPLVFSPVFAILALAINTVNPSGFYFLFRMILTGWVIYLQVIILKTVFAIKTLQAFLMYILPLVALIAYFFIKVWVFISSVTLSLF